MNRNRKYIALIKVLLVICTPGILYRIYINKQAKKDYKLINALEQDKLKLLVEPAAVPTREIWYYLPVSWKNFIRDSGLFAVLADNGAILSGGILLLFLQPCLLTKQLSLFNTSEGRKFNVKYGTHEKQKLDIYYSHRLNHSNKALSPVIVWVYGGAWASGNKFLYRLIGNCFDNNNASCVVCVLNYRIYPEASSQMQVEDILDATQFLYNTIHNYGGDPERMFLLSHSAGAHLSSLAAFNTLNLFPLDSGKPCYKIPIAGVIGLAGVYDIQAHYQYESVRGVEEISGLKPANGFLAEFSKHSPTKIVQQIDPNSSPSYNKPFPILLLSGSADTTVPYTQTIEFARALNCFPNWFLVESSIIPELDHGRIVIDCMLNLGAGKKLIQTITNFMNRRESTINNNDNNNILSSKL